MPGTPAPRANHRVTVDRLVLEPDHRANWGESPGRIPRQDIRSDGETSRGDGSQRWYDPQPALQIINPYDDAYELAVTLNWAPIFVWSNVDSGRYMNHRLWYRIDKGAPNLGGRGDMLEAVSLRLSPGFDPGLNGRHKNQNATGYVHQPDPVEVAAGQQVTVWVGQSIEMDKDASRSSTEWLPLVRHFGECTVTTSWW